MPSGPTVNMDRRWHARRLRPRHPDRPLRLGPGARGGARPRSRRPTSARAARRGYLVFATDPDSSPGRARLPRGLRDRGEDPGEATAKVRPLAEAGGCGPFLRRAPTGTSSPTLAGSRRVDSSGGAVRTALRTDGQSVRRPRRVSRLGSGRVGSWRRRAGGIVQAGDLRRSRRRALRLPEL